MSFVLSGGSNGFNFMNRIPQVVFLPFLVCLYYQCILYGSWVNSYLNRINKLIEQNKRIETWYWVLDYWVFPNVSPAFAKMVAATWSDEVSLEL